MTALSGPALALSGLLTWLKFRADHLCDQAALASCPAGAGTGGCGAVLHDAWATIAGVPLTVYAAAFYATVAALALVGLLRPRTLRATIRPLVLALALAGLAVTLVLAARASLWLGAWCRYCATLYAANVGLALAASLMHPGGLRAGLRPLRRWSSSTLVGLVAGLGLLSAVAAQRAVYLRAAAATTSDGLRPCVLQLAALEPTRLTIAPAEAPARLAVALFVDLECEHCRASLATWKTALAGLPVELRVYQFPRDRCETGRAGLDTSSRCNASRALLCLADLAPEPWVAMVRAERMFALQDDPAGLSNARLAEFARTVGIDADAGRPTLEDPLFSCMASAATSATLGRHVRLAREVARLDAPPGALLVPLTDGRPRGQAFRVQGRKPAAQLVRWATQLSATPEEQEVR